MVAPREFEALPVTPPVAWRLPKERMACFSGSRPFELCPANAVSTHSPFPFQGWMTAAKRADFQ
jgi:hypothetical protein